MPPAPGANRACRPFSRMFARMGAWRGTVRSLASRRINGKAATVSVAGLQIGNVMRGERLSGVFRMLSEAGAESR